ncbi:GH39 family glycosyl hydrolase [Streptantibioticus silvisoli]|uniref:Glycosyl hydrolases family 39 N-terminal catalytic domain-containing protein n=1 Tax=Streptantibioticus silvisoli TaxID=2705255 RepID=A0ABT6W5W3_9ACTN|nr:hypothetical protein [Streptantibioticus silvisoli]MDI5966143.1 hypothetical protein [Streptantibioticus silvisoli]
MATNCARCCGCPSGTSACGPCAHAILGDDLGVYRERDGEPVHDFTGVDRFYDEVMALGLRPVVELAIMPRDLARHPDKTVCGYHAVISPPEDWDRWQALIRDLTAHLVERYGLDTSGAPIDFVAAHVFGTAPLDLRPILARHGREDLKLW